MSINTEINNLTLEDVYRVLRFEEHFNGAIPSSLLLEPVTEFEQQELLKLSYVFRSYYAARSISEGQVKFLFLAPLMWLAGFYHPNITIALEETIADVSLTDTETLVKLKMDVLAVNKTEFRKNITPFWILVLDNKDLSVEALDGLPQLLTYAYKSLEYQDSVWGLTTNGLSYRFVYVQRGNNPTYQILSEVNLIDYERTVQLLQILKGIRKLYNFLPLGLATETKNTRSSIDDSLEL